MKRIERFLFNFYTAYIYTFLAGILVSLAANLLTSVLTENTSVSVYKACGMISLFISSIGAFCISVLLEVARDEWQSDGSPKDPVVIRQSYIEGTKRKRITLLWFLFVIIFVVPILLFIFGITF